MSDDGNIEHEDVREDVPCYMVGVVVADTRPSEDHLEYAMYKPWLEENRAPYDDIVTLACKTPDITGRENEHNNLRLAVLSSDKNSTKPIPILDERALHFNNKFGPKITAPEDYDKTAEMMRHDFIVLSYNVGVDFSRIITEALTVKFIHTAPAEEGSRILKWYDVGTLNHTQKDAITAREEEIKTTIEKLNKTKQCIAVHRIVNPYTKALQKPYSSEKPPTLCYYPPIGYNVKGLDPETGYHTVENATPYVTGYSEDQTDMFLKNNNKCCFPDTHILRRAMMEITMKQYDITTSNIFKAYNQPVIEGMPVYYGDKMVEQVKEVSCKIIEMITTTTTTMAQREEETDEGWIYNTKWFDFSISLNDITQKRKIKSFYADLVTTMTNELKKNQRQIRMATVSRHVRTGEDTYTHDRGLKFVKNNWSFKKYGNVQSKDEMSTQHTCVFTMPHPNIHFRILIPLGLLSGLFI